MHSLLPSHVKYLSSYQNDILGLTGTKPVRPKSTKYQLIQIYCPVVYEYIVKDAVDDKILNDYQIIIHELDLSDEEYYVTLPTGAKFKTTERIWLCLPGCHNPQRKVCQIRLRIRIDPLRALRRKGIRTIERIRTGDSCRSGRL